MSGLQEFAALVAKVDAKVAEIAERQSGNLACRVGCHSCCAPGLTITAVEAAAIRAHLQAEPAALAAVRELARTLPWRQTRCTLLDAAGGCSIYPARPLVCRTQGLPIQWAPGELSCCELNFVGGLHEVPAADRVDQRTLSTLLFVVDKRAGGGARRELSLAGLTAAPEPPSPEP